MFEIKDIKFSVTNNVQGQNEVLLDMMLKSMTNFNVHMNMEILIKCRVEFSRYGMETSVIMHI